MWILEARDSLVRLLGMFDKFRRMLTLTARSPRTIKPMGHVIDIYNFAGGSAKTTVTLNLGYHLAQLGKRVALVDLATRGG